LVYSAAFHFLAGFVAGSLFTIRTLMLMLVLILLESIVIASIYGLWTSVWGGVGIVVVQLGYLSGIYGRAVLEKMGALSPPVRNPRIPERPRSMFSSRKHG
jgi:hypothetical protein